MLQDSRADSFNREHCLTQIYLELVEQMSEPVAETSEDIVIIEQMELKH